MDTLTIDPEFEGLCPALTPEEFNNLEQHIIDEGCRDPIVVWANHADTILDGHNRYRICTRWDKPFKTKALKLATREDAVNWIIANQLGRRNLTEKQKEYLRGKRYLAEKKAEGGRADRDVSGSQSGNPKTAERLGDEYGVSKNTILRNADFAEAVDKIEKTSGPEAKAAILSGQTKLTRREVQEVADLPAVEQRQVIDAGGSPEKKPPKQTGKGAEEAKEIRKKLLRFASTLNPRAVRVMLRVARETLDEIEETL